MKNKTQSKTIKVNPRFNVTYIQLRSESVTEPIKKPPLTDEQRLEMAARMAADCELRELFNQELSQASWSGGIPALFRKTNEPFFPQQYAVS